MVCVTCVFYRNCPLFGFCINGSGMGPWADNKQWRSRNFSCERDTSGKDAPPGGWCAICSSGSPSFCASCHPDASTPGTRSLGPKGQSAEAAQTETKASCGQDATNGGISGISPVSRFVITPDHLGFGLMVPIGADGFARQQYLNPASVRSRKDLQLVFTAGGDGMPLKDYTNGRNIVIRGKTRWVGPTCGQCAEARPRLSGGCPATGDVYSDEHTCWFCRVPVIAGGVEPEVGPSNAKT